MAPTASAKYQLIEHAVSAIQGADVFLVFSIFGSTGSYFFYSLLDNHPDLYTFPFELRRAPVDIYNFDPGKQDEHIRRLLINNDRLFDTAADNNPNNSLNKLGPHSDRGVTVNKGEFEYYLRGILDHVKFNMLNFSLALILSYSFVRGVVLNTNKFAIYTHDFPRAHKIRQLFGKGKFLGTCRHPLNIVISNYSRHFKECMDDRRPQITYLRPYLPTNVYMFKEFFTLQQYSHEPVGLVSLEELHGNPERTMSNVAEYMGVESNSTLLDSTVAGLEWWGSHYTRVRGFNNMHREVSTAKSGKNDAMAVLNSTLRFQQTLGYTNRNRLSKIELFRSRLPSTRYYKDRWKYFMHLFAKPASTRTRAGHIKGLLKDLYVYTVNRLRSENRTGEQISRIDRSLDYSSVIRVIAPLRKGSVELDKDL